MARLFAFVAACFLVPRLVAMLLKPYLISIGIIFFIYILAKIRDEFFD
jgi:hypothetical protein